MPSAKAVVSAGRVARTILDGLIAVKAIHVQPSEIDPAREAIRQSLVTWSVALRDDSLPEGIARLIWENPSVDRVLVSADELVVTVSRILTPSKRFREGPSGSFPSSSGSASGGTPAEARVWPPRR